MKEINCNEITGVFEKQREMMKNVLALSQAKRERELNEYNAKRKEAEREYLRSFIFPDGTPLQFEEAPSREAYKFLYYFIWGSEKLLCRVYNIYNQPSIVFISEVSKNETFVSNIEQLAAFLTDKGFLS